VIDRFFYKFFGYLDKTFEKLNKIVNDLWTFDFPNCKPKNKKGK